MPGSGIRHPDAIPGAAGPEHGPGRAIYNCEKPRGRLYFLLMKRLRTALAQINTTVGDLDGNLARCLDAAKRAETLGADLVVFPELALTGYPPEDLLLRPGFLRRCRKALDAFAHASGNICSVIGFAECDTGIYNAAAVVSGGAVKSVYRKMFLPNYGVFDEKRYFSPGDTAGFFLLNDVGVGLTICEDIWVDGGPYRELGRSLGADVIVNISASPFHAGKIREREDLLRRRSIESDAPIVYVNLVGGQDELVFDGGSLVFDRGGACILRARSFAEELAVIDFEFESMPARPSKTSVRIDLHARQDRPAVPAPAIAPPLGEEEEVLAALVLGTRDYLCKNGFSTAVIGLSGGIDSSLVAAVAVEAMGSEHVVGVTMPSRYTSSGTRSDAEVLASNLGMRFMELPIHDVFEAYLRTLADAFRGTEPGLTEENLQARIRGTLLMALSNKFGWLVLTTGNKSETATGYCTLYGDTAGGFAVIKDVPKTMVFRISRFINERAGRDIIPESVITRPPSAELRPDQKDSDSLPPYDILDPILKCYIEEDLGLDEIVARGFDPDTVRRVFRLSDMSEYKRRQAPPGVKITPRSFGRDRRLPITNRFRDIAGGGCAPVPGDTGK